MSSSSLIPANDSTSLVDIDPGAGELNPTDSPRQPGGYVIFSATDGFERPEPFCGHDAGSIFGKIVDIGQGNLGSSPSQFTYYNGMVYFEATNNTSSNPSVGTELFKTDGTTAGTVLVNDIARNSLSSNPTDIIKMGDYLFF